MILISISKEIYSQQELLYKKLSIILEKLRAYYIEAVIKSRI